MLSTRNRKISKYMKFLPPNTLWPTNVCLLSWYFWVDDVPFFPKVGYVSFPGRYPPWSLTYIYIYSPWRLIFGRWLDFLFGKVTSFRCYLNFPGRSSLPSWSSKIMGHFHFHQPNSHREPPHLGDKLFFSACVVFLIGLVDILITSRLGVFGPIFESPFRSVFFWEKHVGKHLGFKGPRNTYQMLYI